MKYYLLFADVIDRIVRCKGLSEYLEKQIRQNINKDLRVQDGVKGIMEKICIINYLHVQALKLISYINFVNKYWKQ